VNHLQREPESKGSVKILIAEDEMISRRVLETRLRKEGHEVVVAEDGEQAWSLIERDADISLAILDWMMPRLSGPDLCRRIRQRNRDVPTYIMLLTARGSRQDIVAGLGAGADDYITKPQRNLASRVKELEEALANIKLLQGLLPICLYCKKIRDDNNYWQALERYVARYSGARFSHGICPDCYESVVKPEMDRYLAKRQEPASQG
jgi:CheY-like chemotaxis protein